MKGVVKNTKQKKPLPWFHFLRVLDYFRTAPFLIPLFDQNGQSALLDSKLVTLPNRVSFRYF
jgi:hypothetical protein